MKEKTPFLVYNASAGSGKTFSIVVKYLSLLFLSKRKDAYRNILAITFTNKAVEEMKTRIIESLTAFSNATVPEEKRALLEAVQKETGLSEEAVKEKSAKTLKSILHNYAAFEVSTIDAFTNRVLRTFAKDLGLPWNYDLELDVESILAEAVDRTIDKAGEDRELTKTLVNFALFKIAEDKSWDITRDLNEIAQLLTNENNRLPLKTLKGKSLEDFRQFSTKLKKEIQSQENKAKETANRFFNLLRENDLENSDLKYIPGYFSKIQQENFDIGFKAKWQTNILDEPLYFKTKVSTEKSVIIDHLQPQIAELFLESKNAYFQRAFCREIIKNLPQLSLLNAIGQEVEAIRKERGLVLISDFNEKISESIKNQPAPFIYERLGERYRDYFIDEFQDTSLLQWENLIPLIDNPLSSEDEQGKTGTLTLVGDAKQAIYRFRGGRAEQFMALCQQANPFSIEKKVVPLKGNFRSERQIVEFNNGFFPHVSQYLSLADHQELFKNAFQELPATSGGFVNISFVEGKNKEEKETAYCEKTLETIRKLEANKYCKKDICILVRNGKQGVAIANYLSQEEIPIVSSETLLISQSPEVQFLTNLLRLLNDQSDKNSQLELLLYLWESNSLKIEKHQFLSQGLDKQGSAFYDYLSKKGFVFHLETFYEKPFYSAVEYCIRSFRLVEKADAYLQFFLDFVFDFTQKNQTGLSGFIEHWEAKKEKLSITATEGKNAVRIMTVHKSKGLEFPIVIYPFAEEKIDDTNRDNLWIPLEKPMNDIPVAYIKAKKELLEYGGNAAKKYQGLLRQKGLDALNLLYVACTRPEKQLYIFTEPVNEKKELAMNKFSHFFVDYLKSLGKWEKAIFSYDFGEFLPKKKKGSEDGNQETEEKSSEKIFISSDPASNNLQLVTAAGEIWGSPREEAIEQGETLHALLNHINLQSDLEEALKKGIFEGLILAHELSLYRGMLLQITTHPELKEFFEPGGLIFNEKNILDAGTILRPDRVHIKNGSATVIDYKTGAASPKHKTQIDRYAAVLEKMGYSIDKKLLVYINDGPTVNIV